MAEPLISAVVCTRDRGSRCLAAVRSILASEGPPFELLVVDQSAGNSTFDSLAPFRRDRRLRVIRSRAEGVGRARNVGLSEARAEVVAFTDDDCTVPANWLSVMLAAFDDPAVAVTFCNVDVVPHDRNFGFIPGFHRATSGLLRRPGLRPTHRGLGAGLATRRRTALQVGGFDQLLGPGARFQDCEDGDLALRVLLSGYAVYQSSEAAVVHAGFRTFAEGRELTRRNWIGIGAAYSKPIKCGRLSVLPVVLYELLVNCLWAALRPTLRLHRPRGFRRLGYFMMGFVGGLRTPVDRVSLTFQAP